MLENALEASFSVFEILNMVLLQKYIPREVNTAYILKSKFLDNIILCKSSSIEDDLSCYLFFLISLRCSCK